MAEKPWKKAERRAADIMCGKRAWANSGERADSDPEQSLASVWQTKEVKKLSLEALTQLAEEMQVMGESLGKCGSVCVKVRRGRGKKSPWLVVMTDDMFRKWFRDVLMQEVQRREMIKSAQTTTITGNIELVEEA